jgi:hypothetical protein
MVSVLIEGATADEIVALSPDELKALIITGRPVVFRAGSATVLGEFAIKASTLIIELAHSMVAARVYLRQWRRLRIGLLGGMAWQG